MAISLVGSFTQRRVRAGRGQIFGVIAWTVTAVLGVLILYPILAMVSRIFVPDGRLDLSQISHTFRSPGLGRTVLHTLLVVVGAGVPAMALGSLFAWFNERTDARLGAIARFLPLVPFFLPTIAMSVGWVFLADKRAGVLNTAIRGVLGWVGINLEEGPLNIASWPGMIFIYVLFLVPFTYLVMGAALRNIDPALEEASRISGAGVLRTLVKVSIPAVRNALLAALLLTAIMGIGVFSIGAIIGSTARIDILSVRIVRLVRAFPPDFGQAVVLGGCILIVVGALWVLQRRVSRSGHHATIGGKGTSGGVVRLGPWKWVARGLMVLYALAAAVLPLVGLVLVSLQPFWTPRIQWAALSFRNFSELLDGSSLARKALIISGTLGVVGATVSILVAALLTVYARQGREVTANAIEAVTKLPSALSHLVMALGFIIAFGGPPFNLQGTTTILLLAYIMFYMPQATIAASAANDQVGRELTEASAISGARRGRTFARVSLPLMAPGLAAGWAMLFVVVRPRFGASASG